MNSIKHTNITNGIDFYSFIDNRYKTNRISINVQVPCERNSVTESALLPRLLTRGYKGIKNYTEFTRLLENLYGSYVTAHIQKVGDIELLSISITGLANKYTLNNEMISDEISKIICNMFLNPNIINDEFKNDDFELEKNTLRNLILSEINDKRIYASNKSDSLTCENEPFGLSKYGYIEDLDKITAKSEYNYYKEILKNSRIYILYTGCEESVNIVNILKKEFSNIQRTELINNKNSAHIPSEIINEQKEQMDVNQAKMIVSFANGKDFTNNNVYASKLMCAIFGGTPSSKLFMNVREKLSLCYYCSSQYNSYKGIIKVSCGVENDNLDKAKSAITNELEAIKNNDFTDENIQDALKAIKNSLKTVYESDVIAESYNLANILKETTITPDEEIKLYEAVTRKEIVAAAKEFTLDSVYILTGSEVQE